MLAEMPAKCWTLAKCLSNDVSNMRKQSIMLALNKPYQNSVSIGVSRPVAVCPAGASLPPGTHTVPLSQLQTHSLAIQCPQTQANSSSSTAVPAHTQPAALFRLPAAVSLTGQCRTICMLTLSHFVYAN